MRSEVEQEFGKLADSKSKSRQSLITISLDDSRLESFVFKHPDGLIFHHPGYLRALEEESGRKCLLLAMQDQAGSLEAIFPLFYTKGWPFNFGNHQTIRRLCSLPRTPRAGTLSTNSLATESVVREAIHRVQAKPGVHLQIKTTEILPDSVKCDLACDEWCPTYVLTVQPSDRLQFEDARTRHNVKWAVNKAIKLGVTVHEAQSEAELRAWYTLYLATMRRNAVPPRSYKFFLALWRCLKPSGLMRLLVADLTTLTPSSTVAGSLFLMGGSTVFYAFTGCDQEHARTHANDLILWEAIEAARREGYRYIDFGEVADEHPELLRYKKKWGAKPKPLYRYYYPAPNASNGIHPAGKIGKLVRRAWRRLPLPVTSRLGEWIYSRL